jgi:hypothetical protein
MRPTTALPLLAIAVAAAAALPVACLPGDTRPEPASVWLGFESSGASRADFATDDGWSVTFERALVDLGSAQLANDSCNDYADTSYDRLFTAAPGVQKIAIVYGLGSCGLHLRLRSPSQGSLLGEGVTSADLEAMRVPALDAWTTRTAPVGGEGMHGGASATPTPRGTALFVRGTATRDGATKRFAWSFRGAVTLRDCGSATEDGGVTTNLELAGGDALTIPVTFAPEELFRVAGAHGGLSFDPFAGADADGDDVVTLDELEKAPPPGPVLADAGAWTSGVKLGDLVYLTLAPQTVLVRGAKCQVDRSRRGGGGG